MTARPWTGAERARAVALAARRVGTPAIAETLGRSVPSVQQMLYRERVARRGPVRGHARSPFEKQLVVVVDNDMHAAVVARAAAAKTSVSEAVRCLIDWGLESAAAAEGAAP